MDAIISKVDSFNAWFDGLKEPKRFGLFMLLMVASVFILHLGINLGSTWMIKVGAVNTTIVTSIAALRAYRHGGVHTILAKALVGLLILLLVIIVLI